MKCSKLLFLMMRNWWRKLFLQTEAVQKDTTPARFKIHCFRNAMKTGTRTLFHKHLLLTNLAISGGLSAAGDCIEQEYEKLKDKERKYSVRRTLNMTSAGIVIGGIVHYWYMWLDKFMPGRTFKLAFKKMLLDQVIGSPVSIGAFFVTLAIVEGSSREEFLEELKSKSWRLYLAEWIVWPPAQLFNFLFVPLRYRLLYDNTISLGYDVYTSYVKNEIHAEKCSKSSWSLSPVIIAHNRASCISQDSHDIICPIS